MLLPQTNWIKTLERQKILRTKLIEKGYNLRDIDFIIGVSGISNLEVSLEDRFAILEKQEELINQGFQIWDLIVDPIDPYILE